MIKYKNLVIVGTSHIAKESLKKVKETIEKEKPDLVALELDKKRFISLIKKRKTSFSIKTIKKIGLKGFLFAFLSSFISRKLGERVNVLPGSEMLVAYYTAKKKKIPIALIDQDIEITLKRFSQTFSFKEKIRFLLDILSLPFLAFSKQKLKINLNKIPKKKFVIMMINHLKRRYPSLYKVLVEERNIIMAKKLFFLMKKYKKIVVVVGIGHEEGIIHLLKNLS